jgi:signal transduction histidine kinase
MPDARRDEDPSFGRLAEEQAALRRVATLVARGIGPQELFSAVSAEVGGLFGADAVIARFEPDGSAMVVVGLTERIPVVTIGTRWQLEEFLASTVVYRTRRSARSDHTGHRDALGPVANSLRQMNFVSTVAAPIVVEDRVWGVMTVSDKRKPLPPDTEERVESFTELVATAIANADSRWVLAGLVEEQAALRRVATLVARGVSPAELFTAVTGEVARLFGSEAGIGRFEPDGSALVFVGLSEGIRGIPIGTRSELEGFLASSEVYRTGRPARSPDSRWRNASGPIAKALRKSGVVSSISAPIVVEDRPWGVIAVAETRNTLPPDTEGRLEKFTELVATAIANAESRAELAASEAHASELAAEQAALRRVATLVARGAPQDEVFAAVGREAGALLGADAARVVRYVGGEIDQLGGWIAPGYGKLPYGRVKLVPASVTGEVFRTGRPSRMDEFMRFAPPLPESVRRLGIQSAVGAPVFVNGRVWGAVFAFVIHRARLPDSAEARLADFVELVATTVSNAANRAELDRVLAEQAALRRVATLVAKDAKPDEVFSAVAREVAEVLDIPGVTICRSESDGFRVIRSRGMPGFPAGSHWPWNLPSLPRLISESGRPTRIDDFTGAVGLNAAARDAGVKAAVGVPITVAGTVWGSICVTTTRDEPLPTNTEDRVGRFRDLLATSISNAIMRDELAASRARIIAATDDARRRIERDLHDGAQQQLVTLAVALRRAEAKIPAGLDDLRGEVTRVAEGLKTAVEELRELSRGIHPSILTEGGLSPALKALGRRSPVRVKLDVGFEHRLPDHVEVAAYYTVSEALTNAAKHANAMRVWVSLRDERDLLVLSLRDDGVGGADPSRGSGLTGLRDRIEALGGELRIESRPGRGTDIEVQIPISQPFDRPVEAEERPSPTTTPAPAG